MGNPADESELLQAPRRLRVMWRSVALLVVAGMLAGCGVASSSSAAPTVPVAAARKLHLVRESFANPHLFNQAASLAEVSSELPIAQIRPSSADASDHTLDSVWVSKGDTWGEHSITLVWKSGVVETIERWRCNCEATAGLRQMGHEKPFRFLMLRGAPAITAPSNPHANTARWIGPIAPAEAVYGAPASVETIRDGYNITLWQYGAQTQTGLIATAETLPVAHTALRVRGYEAGGAALGDWNGRHGIDVAPKGGARFGIGVALKNISGRPLTITGVNALNGFIRLIGVHFRRYMPPTGSAIGRPIVRAPFDATPERLDYRLQSNAWVGVQLDYQVRDPCIHWSQTIYDRTVEVTYIQGSHDTQIQEAPMVPLNITRPGAC
jgi:hypothetical protein